MSSYDYENNSQRSSEPTVWNRDAALEGIDGDLILLGEIINAFLKESPRLVRQIELALSAHDAIALELAAHSLRGSLGYLGVPAAHEAALRVETAASAGDMTAGAESFAELRSFLEVLWIAFGKYSADAQ